MNWTEIILMAIGGGSILYLLVDRATTRRKYHAEAKGSEVQNAGEVAKLYQEIDMIVKSKTAPLEGKIDELTAMVNDLRENWCCYREKCEMRIRSAKDAGADVDTHSQTFIQQMQP